MEITLFILVFLIFTLVAYWIAGGNFSWDPSFDIKQYEAEREAKHISDQAFEDELMLREIKRSAFQQFLQWRSAYATNGPYISLSLCRCYSVSHEATAKYLGNNANLEFDKEFERLKAEALASGTLPKQESIFKF